MFFRLNWKITLFTKGDVYILFGINYRNRWCTTMCHVTHGGLNGGKKVSYMLFMIYIKSKRSTKKGEREVKENKFGQV